MGYIELKKKDDVYIVKIRGVMNVSNSTYIESELHEAFTNYRFKKVILDISEIEHVSSSGLRVIVSFYKKLVNDNGKMVVYGMNPNVEKIFKLVEFDAIIPNYNSLEDAVKYLNS